ncbi:unnamed protein product [Scytosiphon promiscuus]
MSLLRKSAQDFLQNFVRGCKNPRQTQYSKRSQVGLYCGKDIRFGNTISFSHKKNRRTWKPNVQTKALYSELLDEWIKFKLTTHALRCVDKAGGIDKYLLKTPDKWLNSTQGSNAKRRIEDALAAIETSGEVTGYEEIREQEEGVEGGLLSGEGSGAERQAS